jgi:hypothetical protein
MANEKFKVVTTNGIRGFSHGSGNAGTGVQEPDEPSVEESRRLVQAFSRIRDPNRRAWLLEQVERIATLKSRMR